MTLVNNGLFTVGQLQQLGGVAPCVAGMGINSPNCTLQPAPQGQENLGSLRDFDLKLSWTYRVELKSHVIQLQPGVGFYNLFNFSNFDLPPNVLTGALTNSAGTINGTTAADRISNRVGAGTGVFNLGCAAHHGVRHARFVLSAFLPLTVALQRRRGFIATRESGWLFSVFYEDGALRACCARLPLLGLLVTLRNYRLADVFYYAGKATRNTRLARGIPCTTGDSDR